MRYLIPAFALATPAFAHPADLPHAHTADWTIPVAFVLIGVAVLAARRQFVRVRTGK